MYQIVIQRAATEYFTPPTTQLKRWAKVLLKERLPRTELTIRIVDKAEMTSLNFAYRKKNKPTNVLSFPAETPDFIKGSEEEFFLGDIVICAEVIEEEAKEQDKPLLAHWAHMVVHGILHLLGYDHVKEQEAEIMEAEEIIILKNLGFNNPYKIVEK